MQIVLALIVGAVIGIAAHFALPHRATRGAALAPVVGAVVGGAVWLALTWVGVGTDSPWLWIASFGAPAVVTFPVVGVVSRARTAADRRERIRLRIT